MNIYQKYSKNIDIVQLLTRPMLFQGETFNTSGMAVTLQKSMFAVRQSTLLYKIKKPEEYLPVFQTTFSHL